MTQQEIQKLLAEYVDIEELESLSLTAKQSLAGTRFLIEQLNEDQEVCEIGDIVILAETLTQRFLTFYVDGESSADLFCLEDGAVLKYVSNPLDIEEVYKGDY